MIRKAGVAIIVAALFLLSTADAAYADNLSKQDKINAVFTLSVGGAILVAVFVVSLGILAFQFLFMTAFPTYSHRLALAARKTPGRAVLLGFVNLMFLFLCFAATSENVPFLAGLFFIAFVLVVSIGLLGQARNLGRSILRKEGDEGGDVGAVAIGFFVIAFLNVIPVFGLLFTLYNVLTGAGAVVLAFARKDSIPSGS
ncbi:MAG: hypothetical protein E3J72_16500 [Planctomycetota bacterium]|nr:MAG: hypothetical protein E3J72_16500 [Planctomycetota bacterium]